MQDTQHNKTVIKLSVAFYLYHAECCDAECRYAEGHYAECRYSECRGTLLRKSLDDWSATLKTNGWFQAGKSYWRGRLCTVDLFVLTSLDHAPIILKIIFTLFYKTRYLNEEVTCTCMFVFLVLTLNIINTNKNLTCLIVETFSHKEFCLSLNVIVATCNFYTFSFKRIVAMSTQMFLNNFAPIFFNKYLLTWKCADMFDIVKVFVNEKNQDSPYQMSTILSMHRHTSKKVLIEKRKN
jgi:hypothetical protein